MKILRIIACFLWKLICNYSILRNCKHYASMRSGDVRFDSIREDMRAL